MCVCVSFASHTPLDGILVHIFFRFESRRAREISMVAGIHSTSIHYTHTDTHTHLMHYSSSIEDKTVNLVCAERDSESVREKENNANSKCASAIVSAFTKTHNAITLPSSSLYSRSPSVPGCLCVLKLWAHKFRNKVDRISTAILGAADKIDVFVCV